MRLGQETLGSISPSFYEQLLCVQISKAQKDIQVNQLFALLGPACVKAGRKHLDEIDPWEPFALIMSSFINATSSSVDNLFHGNLNDGNLLLNLVNKNLK